MTPPTKPDAPQRHLTRTLAAVWSWIFLGSLIAFFDLWARIAYDASFVVNAYNVQSILVFAAAPLLLGLGQTLVIIAGGIDLSIGFIMGFASVVMAQVMRLMGVDAPPGAALVAGTLAALVASAIPGFINGFLIARLSVPAFIGTLGMYGVARGAGYILADGATVSVQDDWLGVLGSGKVLGIPISVLVTLAVVIVLHYVLSQTRFGHLPMPSAPTVKRPSGRGSMWEGTRYSSTSSPPCAQGWRACCLRRGFRRCRTGRGQPLLLDAIAAVVIGGVEPVRRIGDSDRHRDRRTHPSPSSSSGWCLST